MENFYDDVRKLRQKTKKIFIYGAGIYGRNIYEVLKKRGINVDGFIVSAKGNENELFELPIYEAAKTLRKEHGIIVGVNGHNAVAIKKILEDAGVEKENIIWGNEFIENGGDRKYGEIFTMDITTRIGCSVNCKFCPQNLLLSKYFSEMPDKACNMSLDTFETCLDKLPKECSISFCGMAEPFLNDQCGEMIKIACASGRKVDLYTTLVGAKWKDLELIAELPIDFIVLHVADERKYANIPLSDDYYNKVSYLVNKKKKDGTPLINFCNAQSAPDKRVAEICEGKYDILTTMHDRAGNLQDENLFSRQSLADKIFCSICGDKLSHNVLLPDGTVLLCCMDYGMKHVLGNLLNQTYDEIMNGTEINMIKEGLAGDISKDILCRSCSCANVRI